MLIYLATDYSASMVDDIPTNTGVFVMTATDATTKQGYANCPPDDVVVGVHIGACIATAFGQTWLKLSSDVYMDMQFTSLSYQIEQTKKSLPGVMTFGDQSFLNQPVGTYQGLVEYPIPDDAPPLDFVYFFRNRKPINEKVGDYISSTTISAIIAAKSAYNHSEEQED